jgi:squalene-hopene/tetraprenyl-beta-curcumene cyclase
MPRRHAAGIRVAGATIPPFGAGATPAASSRMSPSPSFRLACAFVCTLPFAVAQDKQADKQAPGWSAARQKGVDFLLKHQKDGVFSVKMGERSFPDPGFTGLALAALQSKPEKQRTADEQKVIDAGIKWLVAGQNKDDGSFGQRVQNYTTCAVVMALARSQDPAAKDALAKAQKYVLAIQYSEKTGNSSGDVEYGGVGYGSKGERADLSNLQFAVQALRDTGLSANDEAFARAVRFLQRTQNLKSVNDLSGKMQIPGNEKDQKVTMTAGNNGGAVYYPGESPAGNDDNPDGTRTPRSYGSMTYALLKTYTLCGVKGDDPRVQAAVKWIGENWTVLENPGFDPKLGEKARYAGLYYYYLLLGQALQAVGLDKVKATKDGVAAEVDWRAELRAQLEKLQRADGGWVNDKNDRWYEGLDVLCTCYAMLALETCK